MAALVLDCSAAMAAFLPDERGAADRETLIVVAIDGAVVPAHWPLEIGQALLSAERRKRISREDRQQVLDELEFLPIAIDLETSTQAWHQTLVLADAQALSLYDAAYLELAIRRGLPLATRDKSLGAAAERCGVPRRPM